MAIFASVRECVIDFDEIRGGLYKKMPELSGGVRAGKGLAKLVASETNEGYLKSTTCFIAVLCKAPLCFVLILMKLCLSFVETQPRSAAALRRRFQVALVWLGVFKRRDWPAG
ncbi:hypothetical protein H9Q10_03055 [Eikenella sp. S3360]|uniref:Uncharacterized protein n=1 Tax=Eikenella glucosivorans TaxID=2766967 RepID=A0ABS0N8M1_9NEIS|nr:hypothetical protein [Eikenella glucosivorans]MBH5328646.1 hypothetical protein [Eikenella glucosivorans]